LRVGDDGPTGSSIARVGTSWRLATLNEADHARRQDLSGVSLRHEAKTLRPSTIGTDRVRLVERRDDTLVAIVPAFGVACLLVSEEDASDRPHAGHRRGRRRMDIGRRRSGSRSHRRRSRLENPGLPVLLREWPLSDDVTVPDQLDRTAWHLERAAIHVFGELWIDDLPVGRFLDSPSIFPLPSHPGGVLLGRDPRSQHRHPVCK
jgi:hypothetical protein